jgi:hypothetical protein
MSNSVRRVSDGRDREAVAHVLGVPARHRCVDGEDHGGETGRERTGEKIRVEPLVAGQIELEPVFAAGSRRGDLLDGRSAHGGQGVGQTVAGGHTRDRRLTLVVHHPGVTGRREDQRHRDLPVEHARGQVRMVDRRQILRHQLDRRERRPVPPRGQLRVGRSVDVVEHRTRRRAHRHPTEIADAQRGPEPPLDRVEVRPAQLQNLPEFGPSGSLPRHARPLSGCGWRWGLGDGHGYASRCAGV